MKNNDPIFWPSDDIDLSLKRQRDKNHEDCINILQTQWYQADVDQRFAMGDQDIWGLIFPGVATYRRKIFNFNLIQSHLNMISGYQRRNRKSTICIPMQNAFQKTADQMTKCLYYVHNNGAYQVYSDAFEQGALTQGLGFISIFKDTTNDPVSGDIRLRYIDMKACLYDPYMRKHDMTDCKFFETRQFFDRQEAANIYTSIHDEIMSLPRGSYRDDKFYYMPEVYQIQFPNLVALDEYWYLSSRKCQYLVDTETNECQEFSGDEEDLRVILYTFKKRLKVIEKPKPTVRRTIVINDRAVLDEANPYGIDRYPMVPVLGYVTADSPYYAYKYRGIVRDLRDAQYLFNRRKVADLDILESQQQGLKIKKGTLVTPDDSLNQGNGRVLWIDKASQMSDVEPMPIVPPSPTMIQMEEMLQDVMNRISGVNETLLGTDISDKAGIISMLRNSAGITTLTRLFDQFDEAQRLCGEIIIEMIQKNWTYGKVRQVIGEEPTAEFDNKAFLKYGCKIIQGALTESQQQLELGQLLHLNEILAAGGSQPVVRRIINAMTIQNKDELLEEMEAENKAQQEQQEKMSQLEMQKLQIENETKLAYARSQDGLAMERVAKIQTDRAVAEDKLKRAHQEDTAGLLNLIKAAKELQGMDLTNLLSKLDILHSVNNLDFEGPSALKNEQQSNQPQGVL